MAGSEKIMVASTVERLEVGQVFSELPAHLTVYPWFDLDEKDWSEFDEGMEDVIVRTRSPIVIGGSEQYFGSSGDIAVRRLDVPAPGFNLINGYDIHAGVFVLAHVLGQPKDDTYTGEAWRPHITPTSEFALDEDQELALDNLTVFAKNGLGKVVKAVYAWEDNNG
jgi:hypothetical protein